MLSLCIFACLTFSTFWDPLTSEVIAHVQQQSADVAQPARRRDVPSPPENDGHTRPFFRHRLVRIHGAVAGMS